MDAISVDIKDRNRFVVAFAGRHGKLMMPVDRFLSRADMDGYSQVVVHDPSACLSMCGSDGRFPDFLGFLAFLRETIGDPERLVTTGIGAASFPAMLCGHLLEANVVAAFSPVVSIGGARHAQAGDTTFADITPTLDRQPASVRELYDLQDVLPNWNGRTEFYLHYARESRASAGRAELLRGHPHVHLMPHPYDGRWSVRNLAACGLLHQCFLASQTDVFDEFYQNLPVVNALADGGETSSTP